MLPLILGIGAAALLLGHKVAKRVRSNPRKRRMVRRRSNPRGWGSQAKGALIVSRAEDRVRRSALSGVPGVLWPDEAKKYGLTFARCEEITRAAQKTKQGREANRAWWRKHYGCEPPKTNPHGGLHKKIDVYVNGRYFWSTNKHATCASARSDALAALRKRAAAGKVPVPPSGWNVVAHFDSRQRNPSRRRKGKRVSVDQAASRLAWWRWHHNPADSVWRLVKVHPRRGFAQRHPVWEFEHKRTGERRRIVQNWRGPAPAGWPHLPETNPRRRRRSSRRK